MEILNSRLQKLKSKKGFTLIELLAVIAIIAILVLIAAPSFLGNKEKAVLAAVKADIKTAELAIGIHLLEHETLAKQTVNGKEVGFDKYNPESGKDYYSNKGKLDTPVGGELYDISKIIDSKVLDKGDLVASDNGKVYFVTDEGQLKTPGKGNSSTEGTGGSGNDGTGTGGSGTGSGTGGSGNDGTGTGQTPEVKPTPNPESDFEWIVGSGGYAFPGKPDKGYWKYIGTSTEVVIPEKLGGHTLTSYQSMFYYSSVTKVTSTNKNVTDMSYMFQVSRASSLDLSNLDTSNVTNMRNMFNGSYAGYEGKTLDLSNFNTSKVTNMSYMFQESKATSLDLSNFDTSNVTDMSDMFQASRATSLDLRKFNTSNVTEMGTMFSSSQATSLNLSSFDTSNVTNMTYMFYESKAKILDLSSFNTSNVTNTYRMFEDSQATTGIARTQADADKFNATDRRPSGLTFTVE